MYKGGSRREEGQPGHTLGLRLSSRHASLRAVPSGQRRTVVWQLKKTSFRETRCLGFTHFCRHQQTSQASFSGPSHDFRKGMNSGSPLNLGRNSTALSLLWAPRRGSDYKGEHSPILSLMAPPAFL